MYDARRLLQGIADPLCADLKQELLVVLGLDGVELGSALVDEVEFLREIALAERQLQEGLGIPHEEVVESLKARMKARLGS
jgi:hypothetical protein